MKVLVLFEYANHYLTIDSLCDNLVRKGVEASSFNITYWRFRNGTGDRMPLWIRIASVLAKVPGIRGVITGWFRHRALLQLSGAYDIIDIHFFSRTYDRLISELKSRGKRIKITIWGSDFYKSDERRREQQGEIYQLVDAIQTETQQVKHDFTVIYPELAEHVRVAHFGIQFDIIDGLLEKGNRDHYRALLGIPVDRTVLTLGTNGSQGHQHMKMLESIGNLSPAIRGKLFLIIPMNYGGIKLYIDNVRATAEKTGIPFMVLTSFLNLREMCKYRIASDITLTIQATDSLSSAIQEHIYTGEILIAGDWLPYRVLDDYGVYYLKTSLNSLEDVLAKTIANRGTYSEKCSRNRERISSFSAWDHVIGEWIEIYSEIA